MKRRQLFEYEDQPWFPSLIRNYGTDFLQFIANKMDLYRQIVPLLEKGLKKSGHKKIIDLASGGGGGWKTIVPRLKKEIPELQVTLTDLYPNKKAYIQLLIADKDVFKYVPTSVNAVEVPQQLAGMRTLFLAFHHFDFEDARNILQNAVDDRMPIAIFEIQERNMEHVLRNLITPFLVLLTTPFIKPFSFGRLIYTYIFPIVPLFVLWDGIASVWKTYTIEEMNTMIKDLKKGNRFKWETGKIKDGPITILYLLGIPK